MNIANKLTILRVFMIPFFLLVLYVVEKPWGNYAAFVVFALASLTDWLDGYLARSRNLVTDFGKFMDPLADKLLVAAALVYFVEAGMLPAWVVILIISREFVISGFRLVAATNGQVIAASNSGKVKTASTMVMILYLLLGLEGSAFYWIGILLVAFATVMTLWSLVEYIWKNIKIFHA
ncbi:CDP-diacylglycerol--glycerol-3-phosphate 3-phosphatidyltransferase [Anaerotalea alkaliphila]|uniref:CDP-diacylglycerol--glycerol-3-phosphate 3-phosphatidyltransferase n=1 Tax=Anaerotalea alkaliphila TaxID=2662126 RepID=A0A7X5HTB0_9FIRM|nr:CDP-diacylglycerol--glycerol-3-phosphate 3-phosphatidyltransferase [Anaerotalea alkaliphila]NDL66277.1 CDP-diacylglycerol--glycerol-3-phosphate 3-phosphatidyltransferase [Anaerotalea alkaliphila]